MNQRKKGEKMKEIIRGSKEIERPPQIEKIQKYHGNIKTKSYNKLLLML